MSAPPHLICRSTGCCSSLKCNPEQEVAMRKLLDDQGVWWTNSTGHKDRQTRSCMARQLAEAASFAPCNAPSPTTLPASTSLATSYCLRHYGFWLRRKQFEGWCSWVSRNARWKLFCDRYCHDQRRRSVTQHDFYTCRSVSVWIHPSNRAAALRPEPRGRHSRIMGAGPCASF